MYFDCGWGLMFVECVDCKVVKVKVIGWVDVWNSCFKFKVDDVIINDLWDKW